MTPKNVKNYAPCIELRHEEVCKMPSLNSKHRSISANQTAPSKANWSKFMLQ